MNDTKLSLVERLMLNAGIKKEEKSISIDISKAREEEDVDAPSVVKLKRVYTAEERLKIAKGREVLKESKEFVKNVRRELKGTGLHKNIQFTEILENNKRIAKEVESIKLNSCKYKLVNKDGSEYKKTEAVEKSTVEND